MNSAVNFLLLKKMADKDSSPGRVSVVYLGCDLISPYDDDDVSLWFSFAKKTQGGKDELFYDFHSHLFLCIS